MQINQISLPPLLPNHPLHPYSTFGIGGRAQLFAEAHSVEEMAALFSYCKEKSLPFFILGKGSNSLFDDRGYKGLVILNKIDFIEQKEQRFRVGAGYSLARLGQMTAKLGFSGLEFGAGIPATVGGALYMNAGAHGQEAFDRVEEVHYLTFEGELLLFKKEELRWSYRHSCFQEKRGAIIEATFALTPSNEAKERGRSWVEARIQTQPLSEKSCGCIFQNPPGYSAGQLIDQSGLKGASCAGAAVSEKHANFIINRGGATQADVIALIALIKEEVYKKSALLLKEELRVIPYEE